MTEKNITTRKSYGIRNQSEDNLTFEKVLKELPKINVSNFKQDYEVQKNHNHQHQCKKVNKFVALSNSKINFPNIKPTFKLPQFQNLSTVTHRDQQLKKHQTLTTEIQIKQENTDDSNITSKLKAKILEQKLYYKNQQNNRNFNGFQSPAKKLLLQKVMPPIKYDYCQNRTKLRLKKQQLVNLPRFELSTIGTSRSEEQLNKYFIKEIIGRGNYAIVKLALNAQDNQFFALKIYNKHRVTELQQKQNLQREIIILKQLQHPAITRLQELIDEVDKITLVLEYISKVSLTQYLNSQQNKCLDEEQAKKIFIQIAEGIKYCHDLNIAHRDIKTQNILINKDTLQVKICDFGFSIQSPPNQLQNFFCGTPQYMAPELVSKQNYNPQKTDIWSLGILLYILVCGNFPFIGINQRDLFRKIQLGKFEYSKPISYQLKILIQLLLQINPNDRPSMAQILQNSWLTL